MRLTAVALLAAAAASVAAAAAEAQSRKPLRIVVTPRSYLDAGMVAPVGSMSNYAIVDRFSPVSTSPQFIKSEAALPPRIGGGRNPFGPIDWRGGL
jgi:hypothetical protein